MKSKSLWVGVLAAPILIAALLLAGSTSVVANDEGAPASTEVKIDNFSFSPQEINVAVGTSVTWTNRDDIPHTVVSTDGVFKSKVGIRMRNSPTRLPRREHIPTIAQSTPR